MQYLPYSEQGVLRLAAGEIEDVVVAMFEEKPPHEVEAGALVKLVMDMYLQVGCSR